MQDQSLEQELLALAQMFGRLERFKDLGKTSPKPGLEPKSQNRG